MTIDERLLEIRNHTDQGYRPVIDFSTWRVAVLNYGEDLKPTNIASMQRHDETDEVFVLLKGRCLLYIGDGLESVTEIFAENMHPHQVYNVKKGVWHNHTLSEDAMVLIVENRNTTYDNSPFCPLQPQQRRMIIELAQNAGY